VCGLDEAGRGPLAGPVVASAVILNVKSFEVRIDDSKRLSERQREKAFDVILQSAVVGIGTVGPEAIDQMNILQASRLAMERALLGLEVKPDFLLIDGNVPLQTLHQREYIPQGDQRSLSIACASIIAKVTRDRIMYEYDKEYPEYGFAQHKGYPTRQHLQALRIFGPSPIHRKSFRPVSELTTRHANID